VCRGIPRALPQYSPVVRIYDEIARRRREGIADLQADVIWRIQELSEVFDGRVDLTVGANREAFGDVLEAFVPDGFGLVLVPSTNVDCVADMEAGGKITFRGLLPSDQAAVATVERTVWVARGFTQHHGLTVVPRYRGNRIAPRCFVKSVALYDRIGIKEIYVRAAHSGSWYWAQWGFHFTDRSEIIRMIRHTQSIVDAFGAGLDVSTFVHPQQFFHLGHGTEITFDDLIAAFPDREEGYEQIAHANGLGRHQPIPFARAVLLTGPSWTGCLSLDRAGADRLIFDDVARKMVI
jgi:GNAT superfamily N-acetyltransferase